MRKQMLLLVPLIVGGSHALAVGDSATPRVRTDSPVSQYKRVPMEFFGSGIRKEGRWIRVDGLGRLYIAPNFPPPYPHCTIESPQGARCYEDVPQ